MIGTDYDGVDVYKLAVHTWRTPPTFPIFVPLLFRRVEVRRYHARMSEQVLDLRSDVLMTKKRRRFSSHLEEDSCLYKRELNVT